LTHFHQKGYLTEMSILDLSYFDRNHFIIFPKPPLRPATSQDVKHGIIMSGVETSLWEDFVERLEDEFHGDYDPAEEKLCIYFHKGPRYPFPSITDIVSIKEFGIACGH